MVNILIIDSVSGDRENCIDIQMASVEPTQDYIDHTNGVIDIINEEFSKAGQEVRDDAQGQDRAPQDHEEGERGSCDQAAGP